MLKMTPKLVGTLTAFSLLLCATAQAGLYSTLAVDNATVLVAGPRPGENGKKFYNIEGNQNGEFASFGVADFDSVGLGIPPEVDAIRGLTVTLTQANAAFTHAGMLNFRLTTDTATDIQPSETDPAVRFDLTDDPNGLGAQMSPRFDLGSGTFTEVEDGHMDAFSFSLSEEAQRYLLGQIRAGGRIRIVVSPADGTVAATYAGFTHPDFAGPVLTVAVGAND